MRRGYKQSSPVNKGQEGISSEILGDRYLGMRVRNLEEPNSPDLYTKQYLDLTVT
jgi:hypothetical protein